MSTNKRVESIMLEFDNRMHTQVKDGGFYEGMKLNEEKLTEWVEATITNLMKG